MEKCMLRILTRGGGFVKHFGMIAVLCCAVIGFCGCSQEQYSNTASSSGSALNSIMDKSSIASAFEAPSSIDTKYESPDLIYLGTTGILESPALPLYKQSSGGTVTMEYVSDSAYEDRLSEMISSDNSPDLTDKRENTFPYLISKNSYEDLTVYMDTAAPQWVDYTDYIEHYSFKGSHYFYPTNVRISPEMLVYDKKKFVMFNIPDPEKLLEKDEWTWENFRYCARTFTDMEGTGLYGYGMNIADNMLAATGISTVCTDSNGKPSFGLYTDNYNYVREFYSECFFNQKLTDTTYLKSSRAAFLSADEELIGELRKTSFTLGIVPYPRWEGNDAYYVKAVTDGYLVPKGAKNVKNAASFINCSRLASISEEREKLEKQQMKDQGLLISDIEWLNTIRTFENITPVISDVYCLDEQSNNTIYTNLLSADGLAYGEDTSVSGDSVVQELDKIGTLIDN